MDRLTRGTFLRIAGGCGAAAVNFLYPGMARGAAPHEAPHGNSESLRPGLNESGTPDGKTIRRMVGPDPTFAGGEVVAKTPDGIILQSHYAVRAVRLSPDTSVWKEFDVMPDAIQLHDWVDVKGTPLPDGSLQARSGWVMVNIGRLDGVVEQVNSPTSLTVRNQAGGGQIELSRRLEVIHAEDASLVDGQLVSLPPGTRFGAVGLRLPDGGFRATRIWKY